MSISLHALTVGSFAPMLKTLSGILAKAAQEVRDRGGDAEALFGARLADDMLPLSAQVQIATDHAKGATARLTGRTPPVFEDTEKTLADLDARIAKTVAFVEAATPNMFEGGEARTISFPLMDGVRFEADGASYLRDWALPQFYFHVVTAYDILRHEGATIGKRDFMAHVAYAVKAGEAA